MLDDAALLRLYAAERSEAAFGEFVSRHLNFVYATSLRHVGGDPHRAAEVSQEVFTAVARQARSLEQHPALKAWLYTVARNTASKLLRAERVRSLRESAAQALGDGPPVASTPGELAADDLGPVLDHALTSLNERERQAVFLRFMEGRGYSEIGARFAVTADAARLRVERSLEKMRSTLSRQGITSTTAALAGVLTTQGAVVAPSGLAASITGAALSSPAIGGGLSSLLTLMSTAKIQTGIAVTLILVAAGVVVHDHIESQASATRQQTAQRELAAAFEKETAASQRIAALQQHPAKNVAAHVTASASTSPARPAVPTPKNARTYLTDPDYQRLAIVSSLARRNLEFQRLYRRLGLTPEQTERFERIMTIQDQANLDAAVLREKGGDPQTVFRQSGPEWSSEMEALLGPDGFSQLKDYLKTMPVRAFIDSLAGPTAAIGAPLTLEQADRLAEIALANDSSYKSGKGTDPGTVNWTAVWPEATRILSPAQFTTFQTKVQIWQTQKELQRRLSTRPSGNG